MDVSLATSALTPDSHLPDNMSLDLPTRKVNPSLWQTLIHFREKQNLDAKISHAVIDFFYHRYQFVDRNDFSKVWKTVGKPIWTPKNDLTAGTLRALDKAFKERLVYHGPGIDPPIFDLTDDPEDKTVRQIAQAIIHGAKFSSKLIQPQIFKAIVFNKNPQLLEDFRKELQYELDVLMKQLPETPGEEVVWRAFLGNIIALLPFCYPPDAHTIHIPILEGGLCRRVEYSIQNVPLAATNMATPMIMLVMDPINDSKASRIISIIGTTFPAGDGFIETVLADFTPQLSVGESIYNSNKEKIGSIMDEKKDVWLFGVSLGGAMAFHLFRHHHQQLKVVHVYNPPGLYSECWNKIIEMPAPPEGSRHCEMNIYCQAGDIVTKLGTWPEQDNVNLYKVIHHQKNMPNDPLSIHARVYTGCERLTIIKGNAKEENQSFFRRFLTYLHLYLGPIFFYYPLKALLYCYYFFTFLRKKISAVFSKTINN